MTSLPSEVYESCFTFAEKSAEGKIPIPFSQHGEDPSCVSLLKFLGKDECLEGICMSKLKCVWFYQLKAYF